MTLEQDIEIEITFLPTEQMGRKGFALSGYRGQFYYDGHDWDAVFTFVGAEEKVHPGDTVIACLVFLSPQEHVEKLCPGKMFLVREGSKTVAYGKVTKILALEASADWVRKQFKK